MVRKSIVGPEMRKIVLAHLLRRGDRPVVSVMEKKAICAALLSAVFADASHEFGIVPEIIC